MTKPKSFTRVPDARPDAITDSSGPLTRRDLPPPDTKRWITRRKADVVTGVRTGLISLDEACRRYALSVDEFRSWQQSLAEQGLSGLRATRSRRRRR